MVAIFAPDTNFFLQCKPASQLDWSHVTDETEVLLVVVKEVRRELDRHKSGGNERRARRARRVLTEMRQISAGTLDKVLLTPPGAKVAVWLTRSPRLDPNREKSAAIDLSAPDERIVEEAYVVSIDHFGGQLTLLTHDSIPLECAHDVGLDARVIPDEWLLEPEPNEQADQLRKLADRVTLLEGRSPKLSFGLADGSKAIETTIECFPPLSEAFIAKVIGATINSYPMGARVPIEGLTDEKFNSLAKVFLPSDAQWSTYEANHQDWRERFEKRLRKAHLLLNAATPGIRADWKIVNTGACSAERLIVEIRPQGAIFFDDHNADRKIPLGLPKPPSIPRTTFDGMSAAFSPIRPLHHPTLGTLFKRERHEFSWELTPEKRANLCRGTCEEFRHGLQQGQTSITIRPSEPIGGWISASIRFLVSAANIAQAEEATIPVKIRLDTQSTESKISEWLMRDLNVSI